MQSYVKQAVVMAGGKGTRLHPYSALFPKPLMPLGDMPILELLLRRMKKAGIEEVILAVNHLRHLIEAFFGDGRKLGLSIRYFNEDKPLGTAGALGGMMDELDETFIVSNGDLLTSMDLCEMARQHRATEADASIGVFQRENKIDFGLIEFDAQKRLCAYREKPTLSYDVSMGIYVYEARALQHLPDGPCQFPDLVNRLLAAGETVCAYRSEASWFDLGTIAEYERAVAELGLPDS